MKTLLKWYYIKIFNEPWFDKRWPQFALNPIQSFGIKFYDGMSDNAIYIKMEVTKDLLPYKPVLVS